MYTETIDRNTGQLSGAWACYLKANERGSATGQPRAKKEKKEVASYNEVNAGLAIRDKLRAAAKREETPSTKKSSREEPLYALGRIDEEEGYLWAEPINDGSGWPMETYETASECDHALKMLGKNIRESRVQGNLGSPYQERKAC